MSNKASLRHDEKCGPEADEMLCVPKLDRRMLSVSTEDRLHGEQCTSPAVSDEHRTGEEMVPMMPWGSSLSESDCEEGSILGASPPTCSSQSSDHEFGQLDIDLDRKSKRHNLTTNNVRTLLHEVVTHKHVVAMMKAAIKETQDLPMFEPKMTRSRLRKVVEQGEPVSSWNLSPVKAAMAKLPQFVDILLGEEEDSSDEEYCPTEEEEDETAEEMFLSDVDSIGSSPRVIRSPRQQAEPKRDAPPQKARWPRHLRVEAIPTAHPPPLSSSSAPQQLLTPPSDSSFLERLHAVEEELAFNAVCHSYQPLNGEGDLGGGDDDGSGLVAFRTRSKRPLRDVPLGQLEAELLAPDITADMYEGDGTLQEEDRRWSSWLRGLMASDNEEEVDDDDDPEYNFLEELEEPDQEDYRTDRAVRITKKEVNQLLEEVFDTFQEEEEKEEEDLLQTVAKFNVPQALRFEAPLASMLTERRRAVREQYEALQQRRALQETPTHNPHTPTPGGSTAQVVVVPARLCPALFLDHAQKLQLQQQVQQHVQILTQVHLLSLRVPALHHEAFITKQYLEELQQFAQRREESGFSSSFRVCNLQGALELLQEVQEREDTPSDPPPPPAKRWLPTMSSATSSRAYPQLPSDLAWLLATRYVFLYPELLPVCSLDPALHRPRPRTIYTSGEDCLIVLGMKHFEGTVLPDQLLSSYLLRKRHQLLRKHISEMCGPNAAPRNVIKLFCQNHVVPMMPAACSRVLPGEQRPPVDRDTSTMPNWLKKSQPVIQKAKLTCSHQPPYPLILPTTCTLRLHPSLPPPRTECQTAASKRSRIFPLAHTTCLPPLARAPADRQADRQPDSLPGLARVPGHTPSQDVILLAKTPSTPIHRALPLGEAPVHGTVPLSSSSSPASLTPSSTPTVPAVARRPDKLSREHVDAAPPPRGKAQTRLLLPALPLSSQPHPQQLECDRWKPRTPSSSTAKKPNYILVQTDGPSSAHMLWMSRTLLVPSGMLQPSSCPSPPSKVQHPVRVSSLEEQLHRLVEGLKEEEEPGRGGQADKLENPMDGGEEEKRVEGRRDEERMKREGGEELMEALENSQSNLGGENREEQEERSWTVQGIVTCNGGEESGGEEGENREGCSGGGGEEEPSGEREGEHGGEERGEEEEDGERDEGQSGGEKDDDGDPDRQGEEEEEDDFDELTQDEDEEEVMSSASEESVLSVPELQETMKQLTWLASEGRLCGEADSEEEHSPTSPGSQNSQEDNSEEEEEGPAKGEESGEGGSTKVTGEEEVPSGGDGAPRGGGKTPGRGRGRPRPPPRRRQERHSKDSAKLLLLYDAHILDNDPQRDSKDTAFAQAYLSRVREALQDVPGKVEEFLALLYEFERAGEGRSVVQLFRRLRCVLGDETDLLRDFAAFLQPEQALECGLFEEQQAFERSRRFLRQLEISFGENPSHYQKIMKALQGGPDLSPASIHELKAQMATLLKGHTHLQGEFWVFFDELRPPPARPGQFEEAHWPEEGGGGSDGSEAIGSGLGGSGFEEVTLPELEEEEDGQKIPPMVGRQRRRKIVSHGNYKECDWSDKDWLCLCQVPNHDAKLRRHKRKGCARCHGNKPPEGDSRAVKSLDRLYSECAEQNAETGPEDTAEQADREMDVDSGANSPQPEHSVALWEGTKEDPFPLADGKEEEEDELEDDEEDEEERKNSDSEHSPVLKKRRGDEEEERKNSDSEHSPVLKKRRGDEEEERKNSDSEHSPVLKKRRGDEERSTSLEHMSFSSSSCSSSSGALVQARPSPPSELPVCAKNISLSASGEKVILWTREADRVILTTCQQEGANQNTFQAVSTQLGNKTPNEVSRRFRDLMRLFRTAARQTNSEDEAPPTEPAAANQEDEQE
ncbi:GON-4-like protein isoform 2-T2 [Polymixia lowei]